MSKVKLTIGIVFSYLVATEPHWPRIWYRWIPLFRSPKGSGKKFEIAGFQNNWGSVKFRTMKHFLIKYFSRCCCIGKSLSALLLLVFSNTFFEWQLACLPSNLGSLNSKQTVVWESLYRLTDLTLCWSLGSFFLYSVVDKFEITGLI